MLNEDRFCFRVTYNSKNKKKLCHYSIGDGW